MVSKRREYQELELSSVLKLNGVAALNLNGVSAAFGLTTVDLDVV